MQDTVVYNSLKSDPTGDRLGASAMMTENKKPVSQTGIAPRDGVSLYSHYEMDAPGRQVFADGLLDALGNGVGIFCVSKEGSADTVARAFYAHYPGAVSSAYGSITGNCSGSAVFTSPTWTEVSSNPAFASGGFGFFMADGGDGFLYMARAQGGFPTTTNTVWRSADGITWVQRNNGAAFESHFTVQSLALLGSTLFICGDFGGVSPGGKTYSSTDGGVTWTQTETHAVDTSWGQLQAFGLCAMGSKLWIVGGLEKHASISDTGSSSVWSSPDGVTWTNQTTTGGFGTVGVAGGRWGHGLCSTGNTLVVIGGVLQGPPSTVVGDVWSSSDGISWTQINAGGDFAVRAGIGCFAPNGTPMFYGGGDFVTNIYDDLWTSADGGATWVRAFVAATGAGRLSPAFTYFDDAMWISCGETSATGPVFAHDVYTSPISVACIFL